MTDRYAGFLVTLKADMREDDAEAVITALRMVKHVLSVDPMPADPELHMATVRARFQVEKSIFDLFREAAS